MAVKTIQIKGEADLESDSSPSALDESSFIHEVQIMARLQHPNVVMLLGASVTPPQVRAANGGESFNPPPSRPSKAKN